MEFLSKIPLFLVFIVTTLIVVLIIGKRSNEQEAKRKVSECVAVLEDVLAPFDSQKFADAMARRGIEIEPWMFKDAKLKHVAWQKYMMSSIRLAMEELRLYLGHEEANSEPWKTRMEEFQAKVDTVNNS